jgi:lactobin A/cerein 7B family class IIb bacteriocin
MQSGRLKMKDLTVEECERVDGGLVLAIIGCAFLLAAGAAAIYAGYKYEESQDPTCEERKAAS